MDSNDRVIRTEDESGPSAFLEGRNLARKEKSGETDVLCLPEAVWSIFEKQRTDAICDKSCPSREASKEPPELARDASTTSTEAISVDSPINKDKSDTSCCACLSDQGARKVKNDEKSALMEASSNRQSKEELRRIKEEERKAKQDEERAAKEEEKRAREEKKWAKEQEKRARWEEERREKKRRGQEKKERIEKEKRAKAEEKRIKEAIKKCGKMKCQGPKKAGSKASCRRPCPHDKRRVNQETQSPVLKIFQDVMLREASDQEKISLLSDRPDECKRNQYSTECHTTLLEIPSRREPFLHAEKKDSRKLKGKKSEKKFDKPFARQFDALCAGKKKESKQKYCSDAKCSGDETFSCNSCALKKILFREYKLPCNGGIPGVAILAVLLLVVIYLAVGGCNWKHFGLDWSPDAESKEDLRTTKTPQPARGGKGARNVEVGLVGRLRDTVGLQEGMEPRPYVGASAEGDLNAANDGYQPGPDSHSGMSYLNNLEANFRATEDKDLEKILRNNKDFRTNKNLQHFYKRLLATDAQIQRLKKSYQGQASYYNKNSDTDLIGDYYPRYKRSLRQFKRPFARTRVEKKHSGADNTNAATVKTAMAEERKISDSKKKNMSAVRILRQITDDLHNKERPKILIQKRVITVHPVKNDRQSKCTHVQSDGKSHETKLKHPFYKNSQRLDEMLDQLLGKNLNHVLTDPLQDDPLFKNSHSKQGKFAKGNDAEESKVFTAKPARLAVSENVFGLGRFFVNPFKKRHEKKKAKGDSKIPLLLDEFLSNDAKMREETTTISTTIETTVALDRSREDDEKEYPEPRKSPYTERKPATVVVPSHHRLTAHAPNLRRILQVDDAYDSSLRYADGGEVLRDELEPHDDAEKGETAIGKRSAKEKEQSDDLSRPIVYANPNWKGPIPLYSDEIRDLLAAPPVSKGPKGDKRRVIRSTAKLADYDDRDAQAQAYSDYGVLEGKKDSQSTTPPEITVLSSEYNFERDYYILPEASLKIIRKRRAAPTLDPADQTGGFNETDHLLSVLSRWFGSMAAMANGSDCIGKNKAAQVPAWRPRSLLSVDEGGVVEEKVDEERMDEGKVGNNTEAISEEIAGRDANKTLVKGPTDEAIVSTESASDNLVTIQETISPATNLMLNTTKVFETNEKSNKSIVKRNAPLDEKGLTFWNDVYDEYGVQVDSLDEPMGTSKSSVDLDASKRPKNWSMESLQKYRNLKDVAHDKEDGLKGEMKRIRDSSAGIDSEFLQTRVESVPTPLPIDTPGLVETPIEEKPVTFHELTVKMKNVVSQAAKAVEETNAAHATPKLPLPEIDANGTDPDVGNSLLRQLMSMMADVMDYQVHARTCLQPPEDLRVFLVQLTAPDPDPGRRLRDVDGEEDGYRTEGGYLSDDEVLSSNPTDLRLSQMHDQGTSRSECLDTLRTVQGLMMEYDLLSDEDKKTMTGVKDYLQKQIDFLRSQCSSSYSDFSFDLAPYYQDSMPVQRVKRHFSQSDKKKPFTGKRNKIGRFVKLWSKTSPDADIMTTDSSEESYRDSIGSYISNDKMQVAKQAYEMDLEQLTNLNFDMDGNKGEKTDDKILNQPQKTLSDSEKSYVISLEKLTALPTPIEALDPIFQSAILDPAFQDAHRRNFDHFNDAKRLYEKELKEYQMAKDRLGKSTAVYNLQREEFQNSVKKIEHAEKVYKVSLDGLKRAYDKFSRPKKRNLYDVYYRAVSEAKKMASTTVSKNSYRHTTDAMKV